MNLHEAEEKTRPTLSIPRETAREVDSLQYRGSFVVREGEKFHYTSYLISAAGNLPA